MRFNSFYYFPKSSPNAISFLYNYCVTNRSPSLVMKVYSSFASKKWSSNATSLLLKLISRKGFPGKSSRLALQKNTIQKYRDRIDHNPYSSDRLQTEVQRAQAQAHAAIPILGMGCADKPFYYQPKRTYMQPNYLENSYRLTYCA